MSDQPGRSASRSVAHLLRENHRRTHPDCRWDGPHFVPPSMGDPGFFLCEKGMNEPPATSGRTTTEEGRVPSCLACIGVRTDSGQLPIHAPGCGAEGRVPSPEERARDEHQACHDRWDRLTDEQRQGTTFHGWDAHLRGPDA